MSNLEHPFAYRYRTVEGTDKEERMLVIPIQAIRCDNLVDPISGAPLRVRAVDSTAVTPHFALKENLNDKDKKIVRQLIL